MSLDGVAGKREALLRPLERGHHTLEQMPAIDDVSVLRRHPRIQAGVMEPRDTREHLPVDLELAQVSELAGDLVYAEPVPLERPAFLAAQGSQLRQTGARGLGRADSVGGVGQGRDSRVGPVDARIDGPRNDPEGLDELAPLWGELHRHHREVSSYEPLVDDLAASWVSRRDWYRRLLAEGASYLTATDGEGRLIGYAMVALERGPDDTFEVVGGTAQIVTLIVAQAHRSAGVGRALLDGAEQLARALGFDTVKIAVMSGNARAESFYKTRGYSIAEHVLYRRLDH